jgi:epoxyqueuosine reductase
LSWTEQDFLSRTEGSAIRRIGYLRWLRNVAVAAGNALATPNADLMEIRDALRLHTNHPDPIVCEHVQWALMQGT